VAALAATAYLAGLAFGWPELRLVVKPAPVLCLAALVLSARVGRAGALIAAGLLCSSLGDVLLELPGRFLPGLGAFLLAHVCYIAAFVSEERRLRPWLALPFAVYGIGVFRLLAPGLGGMATPVLVYAAAICGMMWRAAARVGSGRARAGLALAGAISFALSDTLIALDRFRAPLPGVRWPIMILYWLGQLGIALSFPALGRNGLGHFMRKARLAS
jgi:alkenylglycerophosphocholine hydrolase